MYSYGPSWKCNAKSRVITPAKKTSLLREKQVRIKGTEKVSSIHTLFHR